MSFILDALKKSDQQRQRGATPTLQSVQVTVALPGRPASFYYAVLAVTLLVAGMIIGWLHPWQQPEKREPVSAKLPEPRPAAPVVAAPPAIPSPVQEAPARVPDKPAAIAQETLPYSELPAAIQQELPAMTVQFHAYSGVSAERLVSINSIRLREGGYLMAGLKLEQISPDGMIFSYKGYRFRRGIR